MVTRMKRSELFSRILITVAVLGAIGSPLYIWARTPLIHAKVAENGGWNPNVIHASAGEPLTLHLTSDDVVHSFAVGQMDIQSVDVLPGKVTDVTLTFDKPGIYTFFCTRWCGLNHWRMRGTIEVSGSPSVPQPAEPALSDAEGVPLYVTLGLDIDAPHDAPSTPGIHPSAFHGQQLAANLPIDQSTDYYRTHSPYQVFEELNRTSLTESQRWDVVAYIWQSNTKDASLANGQRLYTQNCAACHGENGAGNGVFSDKVAADFSKGMSSTNNGRPVDFTDATRMLGASPALLQGKILRGGMGTGMPMWGSIFTEEQIWNLIAYLYSFQFEYHN
jgi:mono/diheme cytochrome c family protein/plastocyanin